MDYRESPLSSSSYTPRRRDGKFEAYGGLQLKTRQLDDENQVHQRLRRASFCQETGDYGQENRGVSKRRESAVGSYGAGNSKYLYEMRQEDEGELARGGGREENALREIKGRENRQLRPRENRDAKEPQQQGQARQQQEYIKGSYLSHKRNEMLMKESRKQWTREQPNRKEPQATKPLDPQLVERLCNISKLNNRIRERLKHMTTAMEKGRS